jgi:amino acid adenylation domain-containing protein
MSMIPTSTSGSNLPPEQAAIRAKCLHPSGDFVEFKKEEIEQSIPDRFEEIVRRFSNRVAVKTRNSTWTYDDLNHAANRIAHAILAQRGEGEEPVALFLEHDADAIAAILAVLKSGKIYVPLDPSHLQARSSYIFEDAQASLIVTNNKNFSNARDLARNRCQLLNINKIDSDLLTEKNVGRSLPPDTLAYILYTSGSTGRPKGVVQNHRNVLHAMMNYINGLHISVDDRLTLLHSCSFSGSVYNLFGALLNGATLLPFDLKGEGVNQLGNWLAQEEITICHTVPTAFCHVVQTFTGGEQFPTLRVIHLSGAPVPKADVELYKKHFAAECILVHRMGITETTTIRSYFIDKTTPIDGARVPIGYPVDDKEVLLLDESGKDAGRNCIGEIAVKSRYLSLGYWRRPDLTRAKFLPDPNGGEERTYLTGDLGRMAADGCLLHVGREDFRVKVRGYTVEVSEIELALLEHTAVKEAAVVGQETQSDDMQLVAYFVPSDKPAATVTELRNFLKARLPDYMIPSAFVSLRGLPLTPNGKIDRLRLPDPGRSRPNLDAPYVAARNPIEQQLANIWAEVLSLNPVGIHDNFFDLGGHSLAATRVVSQLLKIFKLELPLQSLFESQTVAEMALVVTEHLEKSLAEEKLNRILTELESLSDEEAKRILSAQPITEN